MSQPSPTDEAAVTTLYHEILDAWNRRSADDFAARFSDAGSIVGFDGSTVNERAEIAGHLAPIFTHHVTPAYVAIVREVRFLAPTVALLRSAVGMVPAGQTDLLPGLNSIQTLVASRHGESWQADMLHTTPAASHGRPELAEALTAELRQKLR